MSKSPIFIHSLFRSGSTYFFNVFRRSSAGYYCFQEALHPATFFLRDNPQDLLKFHTSTYETMRHPNLDKPVFYEVAATSSAWREKITYSAIFDGYFGSVQADNGVEFFRAILNTVRDKKPVFQECRTAGRIGLIKGQLGGFHIYLWRNPWDQWWSYKTIDHLDYQNREIISAPTTLAAVATLRSQLSFQKTHSELMPKIQDGVLTSEERYLTFYLLWCLGLHEGLQYAHLLINIDKLTESKSYREYILDRLAANGIDQLDLSDCHIPQGNYFKEDKTFFSVLEDKVHEWLTDDLSTENLNRIQELRRQHQPATISEEIRGGESENFIRQLIQIRSVSRRFETNKTFYLQKYLESTYEHEMKMLTLSKEFESRIEHIEQEKNKTAELLNSVYNSYSWRVTRPFRWFSQQIYSLLLYKLGHPIKKLIREIKEH